MERPSGSSLYDGLMGRMLHRKGTPDPRPVNPACRLCALCRSLTGESILLTKTGTRRGGRSGGKQSIAEVKLYVRLSAAFLHFRFTGSTALCHRFQHLPAVCSYASSHCWGILHGRSTPGITISRPLVVDCLFCLDDSGQSLSVPGKETPQTWFPTTLRIPFPLLFVVGGGAATWKELRAVFNTIAAGGVFNLLTTQAFNHVDQSGRTSLAASGTIGSSNDLAAHLVLVLPFILFVAMDRKQEFCPPGASS